MGFHAIPTKYFALVDFSLSCKPVLAKLLLRACFPITMSNEPIKIQAKRTRILRKLHRWMGIPLIVFFLVIGVTSILLAWKKKAELLPPTLASKVEQGTWILPSEMVRIGEEEMKKMGRDSEVDRIDIRPDKGTA